MERTFRIEGTRSVTEYVTAHVEAESFDEARDKFYEGDYSDLDVTDTDVNDEDVGEVTCCNCDAWSEDDCGCECDEFDESVNPGWLATGAISPEDICEGDVMEVADGYTRDEYGIKVDGPFEVLYINGQDGDGEYSFEVRSLLTDEEHSFYANAACRFRKTARPTAKTREEAIEALAEAQKAARAKSDARLAKAREIRAVDELLAPTWGG